MKRMNSLALKSKTNFLEFLRNFSLESQKDLFNLEKKTLQEKIEIGNKSYTRFTNEYWTAKQRQANSLHEISYRACFKAQLPRFFIENLSSENDIVYDPFSGRGTTVIEAGLLGRNIVSNDISPISKIFCKPRLEIPKIEEIKKRLFEIHFTTDLKNDFDLSMFFHSDTESEIVSLKNYLEKRKQTQKEDIVDSWIRMVATNRLTGHSNGFFSVYTLPPNQAVSAKSQIKINIKRNQIPTYRDVKDIIYKKSKFLLKDLSQTQIKKLSGVSDKSLFLNSDAGKTFEISPNSIQLTVTSPPFLDVVQYADDNWLRCWFNSIEPKDVAITMAKTIEKWCETMNQVFNELYRITRKGGWVAFEVGEIKNGKIKLDEYVVPMGETAGFICEGIVINQQIFTKTSNIWGVGNNKKGTNSNRIVVFSKQ